jgi:hypothetical protein
LALPQFPRVLQRLLHAAGLGARLVIAGLHRRQCVVALGVQYPRLFDPGFDGAQFRDLRLQRRVPLPQQRILSGKVRVQFVELQHQQFRMEFPLLLLVLTKAPGDSCLPLQVADLLLDLLAQVVQPVQVFARVGNPALRFAATFLVLRDACRFFQKGPQVVGLGLDQARNHPLLNDRVAARTESGAEEQLGDVLATALRAVDEIGGRAVPSDLAPEGHLGVARIGSADGAVAVVEYQLDRGRADRLPTAGAIENDVAHGIAAEVLRGDLAHHPADRIDDVGLAAAVRPDYAGEVAGKVHRRGVHERLEANEFDPGKAHRALQSEVVRPASVRSPVKPPSVDYRTRFDDD